MNKTEMKKQELAEKLASLKVEYADFANGASFTSDPISEALYWNRACELKQEIAAVKQELAALEPDSECQS